MQCSTVPMQDSAGRCASISCVDPLPRTKIPCVQRRIASRARRAAVFSVVVLGWCCVEPTALQYHVRVRRSLAVSLESRQRCQGWGRGRLRGLPTLVASGSVSSTTCAHLTAPVLELITPDSCAASFDQDRLVDRVERAVAAGVTLVQLRDHTSDADSKARLAKRLRAATRGAAFFVVNGDVALARACGADGVHLPERMIAHLKDMCNANRSWLQVVGCSVHSVDAAVEAATHGVDYLQVTTRTVATSSRVPQLVGSCCLFEIITYLQVRADYSRRRVFRRQYSTHV